MTKNIETYYEISALFCIDDLYHGDLVVQNNRKNSSKNMYV